MTAGIAIFVLASIAFAICGALLFADVMKARKLRRKMRAGFHDDENMGDA